MRWRLEIIGAIGPSAAYVAGIAVCFADDSIRLPIGPSIALCLVCVAIIFVGIVKRKDLRPFGKLAELLACLILMVVLFAAILATLIVLVLVSLMMFGLEGIQ